MKIFILLFLVIFTTHAKLLEYKIIPNELPYHTMNINILDTKELTFQKKNKLKFSEISDLAYRDSTLFGIGDKGILYKLHIDLKNDKINRLKLLWAKKLHDNGVHLSKRNRDSEGLAFLHDNLLISFERKHRVELYNQQAEKIKQVEIHKNLNKFKNYKSKNKGLESVAYSENYGVITAPEKPLKGKKYHVVYAKDTIWKFKAKGSITGLEFISKNKILILLREYTFWSQHRVTTLLQLNLKKCQNSICKSKVLARLDSRDGWDIDNFEGLAKVGPHRYVMISDDNENFFQKTLLVLFEIND